MAPTPEPEDLPSTSPPVSVIGRYGRVLILNPESTLSIEEFLPIAAKVVSSYSGPGLSIKSGLTDEVGKKWYTDYIIHVAEFKGYINCMPQIFQKDYTCRASSATKALKVLSSEEVRASMSNMRTEGVGTDSVDSLPTTLEKVLNGPHAGVPSLAEWNPFGCPLPFQLFYKHVKRTMKKKLEWNAQMKKLPIEVFKLRYVEYLAHILKPCDPEFMLGVVTAYGHQVYSYPLRIIDLMKGNARFEYMHLASAQRSFLFRAVYLVWYEYENFHHF